MNVDRSEIKEIFCEALEKATRQDRIAYLNHACKGKPGVRSQVNELLRLHEGVGDFLESPILEPDVTLEKSPLSEGPGTVVGRYKLLERIGEGGMAVVYMAEQEKPIRRKVALKIIKLGMDTRQVIARFEAERQALALMDHPNIARVFDAGATETGRPYFVMELVTGVSITQHCDKNNLSTKDRLALFLQVCQAVQHAHEKGVVHRDLKPSNVMVAHHDGKPVPKVIDFGIAKATNQKLTEKTLFTRYAHIIGTPAYMSPEQAELSDLGIDARSDIYSLGVLLYELLIGTTPFSEEELREAGYLEMQRIIREQEPIKPSTKLSTLGGTLTDIAKRRGCTPDLLAKTVRGDLDWIVMKALEKDRARRYEGASGLALDIERHLKHRPVTAHAPSVIYRLQKFLRRNRLEVGAVLAVVLAVGTIIVSSVGNQHRLQLAEAEAAKQANNTMSAARRLIAKGDLAAACRTLGSILENQYVGLEASTLLKAIMSGDSIKTVMNKYYLEQVQYFTDQIQADPTNPDNYLQRAQQYQYLRDEEKVHADMSRYAMLLGQGWFSKLRFGTPQILPPVANTPSRHQLVFSVGRRDNGIITTTIAFGQKGRSTMKTFEMPMFATSLFLLCFSSGFETPPVYADFEFGTPTILGPTINGPDSSELVGCISADGLEMYLEWGTPEYRWDICVSRRDTIESNWGPPENLGPTVNSPERDELACISSDGLSLYFCSGRSGGSGGYDLWVTTRATSESPWESSVNLGSIVNSPSTDGAPWISSDGLELYFSSFRSGGYGGADIYITTRVSQDAPWGEPVNLGPVVNSQYREQFVSLSPDGLLLLFGQNTSSPEFRPGGFGSSDMWVSRRSTVHDDWGTPVNLGPIVNGPYADVMPSLSPDGRTLYFGSRDRPESYGRWDIWQAPVVPIVDFNGDGKANGKDVVVLTQHWGESDSVCDIGPYAWGDGIVDEQDLFALAEYLEKEVTDPTLVAHWALDEAGGTVAYDSAGDNHGTVLGDAVWLPDGGMVGGALALDGVDDCLVTNPVPELSAGPFSVLAWVKGGAAGEVIVSCGTTDWLYTNPADGSLMTALSSIAGNGVPLFSDVVVTDNQWHRIALVWDGTDRILYVDGQEAARDEQVELVVPDAALIIGAGATANHFFSGQIDDIRIYRRAVKP